MLHVTENLLRQEPERLPFEYRIIGDLYSFMDFIKMRRGRPEQSMSKDPKKTYLNNLAIGSRIA